MSALQGKVALVTGASRGLGAAIAGALGTAGATVAVNYLTNHAAAATVVGQIESNGGRALPLQCDVRDAEGMAAGVQRLATEVGAVSLVVHAAGATLQPTKFAEIAWDDFQTHFEVSVRGAVNCVKACLPGMSAARHGAVVAVASAAAHGVPPAQWSGYVTAKAALLGLVRALAVELGPQGVRVNAVSPGMIPTDLTAFVPDRMKQMIAQQVPLRRLATPAEVAAAVLFLLSDAGAYLNGVALPVAGGSVMP